MDHTISEIEICTKVNFLPWIYRISTRVKATAKYFAFIRARPPVSERLFETAAKKTRSHVGQEVCFVLDLSCMGMEREYLQHPTQSSREQVV